MDETLEEKLRDILDDNFEAFPAGYFNTEAALTQIIQAFEEAGYIHVPSVELVERWEQGKPTEYWINGKVAMTGQAYFDRFKAELDKAGDLLGHDYDRALESAQVAAGITENQETE